MIRLADALWDARANGSIVDACPLSTDEARDVLSELTRRQVSAGRDVVGWKIARLRGDGGEDVVFAGPVFAGYDGPRAPLVAPRVEVEFVARLEEPRDDGSWRLSWHVGLEIVDNHDRDWSLDAAWCRADWAVQSGATLGEACQEPRVDEPVGVRLVIGDRELLAQGRWRTGIARMHATLEQDCPELLRSCRAGDLVWSGALLPPEPLPAGAHVSCSVAGSGSATRPADPA